MTTNDQGPPEDHALRPRRTVPPKSVVSANLALAGDQLVSFLVGITRGTWRLESAVERGKNRAEPISKEIEAAVVALQDELQSVGLQVNDPAGQDYETGMRLEIAHLEPGGTGDLVIKRTILPGVSINGSPLIPASVVVGRGKAS